MGPLEVISEHGYQFATSKPGDVGHDLHVNINRENQTWFDRLLSELLGWPVVVVWPFSQRNVGSGIKLSLTNDLWALILARSSASKKRLFTLGGVIDSGYRGEYHTVIGNFSFRPRVLRQGERYAQVIFVPARRPSFAVVDEFSTTTARGSSGFGSTGR